MTRDIVGVLLAGGQSRRMGGGDKGLLAFGEGTMLGHVIARFAPQVGRLVLNANGDPARFAAFGLGVVPDTIGGNVGPLAGVLAGEDGQLAVSVPVGVFLFGGMLFQDSVEIGAAEAQRADGRAARVILLYPRPRLGVEIEGGGPFGQFFQRGSDFY
ncbi:MAG: NTP transferase domain-containing protein, partial [Alphaproteobacteria bacterium]|nr:NTP transferase domain-containing protein [Alphaproteobacteria bacterium]